MFAYCENDPINHSDPNGEELWGALIGATSSALWSIALQALDGKEIDWKKVGVSAACGFASGLSFGGTILRVGIGFAAGFADSYYSNSGNPNVSNGQRLIEAFTSGGINALTNAINIQADTKTVSSSFKALKTSAGVFKNHIQKGTNVSVGTVLTDNQGSAMWMSTRTVPADKSAAKHPRKKGGIDVKKTSLGPRWEIIIAFVVGLVISIYGLDHFSDRTPYYQSKYIAVILLTCYAAFEGPKMLSIDASGIHQKWAGIRYRTILWTQISQIGLYRYRGGYIPGRTVVFVVLYGAPRFDEEKSYEWYNFRHPFRSVIVDFGKKSPEAFEEYVQTFDFKKTI